MTTTDTTTPDTTTTATGRRTPTGESTTSTHLRRGFLLLAGLTALGTAVELAMRHHWTEKSQWIAWIALALVVEGIVLLAGNPSARTVRIVRLTALAIVGAAAIGMLAHLHGNYEVAPLDAVYGEKWDSMSEAARWWAALLQNVGPSPVLAPGVLVIAAGCLGFATLDHPALRRPAP